MSSSYYPDGTTRESHGPSVAIPWREHSAPRIETYDVGKIVCHRYNESERLEQYLVQWRCSSSEHALPYSWHKVQDLRACLTKLQIYIESFRKDREDLVPLTSRKRPSPDQDDYEILYRQQVRKPNEAKSNISADSTSIHSRPMVFNGTLKRKDDRLVMMPNKHTSEEVVLPTTQMKAHAQEAPITAAELAIWKEFNLRLVDIAGPRVHLRNTRDGGSPPLSFTFINQPKLGKDVFAMDDDAKEGCGGPGGCRPHMGQGIGCEYSRKCQCQEYAAIDTAHLKPEEKELLDLTTNRPIPLDPHQDLMMFPKKFPYFAPGTVKAGNLVQFYLESRNVIYECNDKCSCGRVCKNRVVQKGRTVPLEIFKTDIRGWGLRATQDLQKGQFVDTYCGEIITNEEADRREERAGKGKASYLYSLDKFVDDDDVEETIYRKKITYQNCYVMDGQFQGGPTRFINHSCKPNCRQFAVSMSKNDRNIYVLAFFASEAIPKGTELTFDYLDKDVVDEEVDETKAENGDEEKREPMKCLCGSAKCRGELWV